jgi:hypothetical protein
MTVKASTGMTLPPRDPAQPAATTPAAATAPAESGQPSITEETTAPAVTLSPQLTALARKQQKLQQEIQAQREKEAAWATEKADYIPKSAIQAKFETDALGALKDLGMTYEQFNERILAQLNGADPVRELRSELDQLKKSQEDNVNKQYEATLKQYRAEADSLVASDPKSFHFIVKGNLQDAVVEHIVETWKENPDQVLTVAQAAKEVEEVLREDAKAKAAALKELEPAPAEVPTQQAKKQTLPPPKQAAPRTLTQQVETAPMRTYGQAQHLSMKERIAQAMARAQR